jgi:2'-5' RNA ligase
MRLHAGLVPPEDALSDLVDAVLPVVKGSSEFDLTPMHELLVPVNNFGNVALRDAVALSDALTREAARWEPMRLRFSGAAALEFPGDRSVWARLDGDIEQLLALARAVPQVVTRLGFFVDRRKFRPWLPLGEITDDVTPEFLQGLVDVLEGYRGPSWIVEELTLVRWHPPAEQTTELDVYKQIELRGS